MNFSVEGSVNRLIGARELAADRIIHVIGLAAGGIGAAVLIIVAAVGSHLVEIVTVSTYSLGLVAMLSLSAAYNLARESRHREVLRRFDHAAIFAMIAGTYTPFTAMGLSGPWAVGMTILVWSIAALGVALKLALPRWRFRRLSVVLYLAFGWIGVIALGPWLAAIRPAILILLAAGGMVYSLGVVFYAWRRLPYQNAIWHGFVLAAAAIHYAAVMGLVTG